MDKAKFFDQLISALREEALHAIRASKDAADYATNEEARAESQWDTQGLEASYLAAGQADQARQWAEAIKELQSEHKILLEPKTEISLGALFTFDLEGSEETFFFSAVAGGHVVSMDGKVITVITAQSPLALRLRSLKAGDSFTLPNGKSGKILTVN